MERLTEKSIDDAIKTYEEEGEPKHNTLVWSDWKKIAYYALRELKAYRASGFTPERVAELAKADRDGKIFSGVEMANIACALKKLNNFEEMERMGRLVEIPYIVGQEVFTADSRGTIESIDVNVDFTSSGKDCISLVKVWFYEKDREDGFYKDFEFNDFGKTVFLTRAEAKAEPERIETNG